jgi:hypothetical protein
MDQYYYRSTPVVYWYAGLVTLDQDYFGGSWQFKVWGQREFGGNQGLLSFN